MNSQTLFPPPSCNGFQACSIALSGSDTLRLIGVPESLIPGLRGTIMQVWSIQRESYHSGSFEFKLGGNPWYATGDEGISARRLVAWVLGFMSTQGWSLLTSTDVSLKRNDKDTLFFGLDTPPDPQAHVFSLGFTSTDKIKIIDNDAALPSVKGAIEHVWSQGIQRERPTPGAIELKLKGTPWFSSGDQSIATRMLLNQIIANLKAIGYKLYASVDMNVSRTSNNREFDLETWFFRKVTEVWR